MALIPVFDVMETAADALARIGSGKAINALTKALQHENSSIRLKALVALINISTNKVINDEAVDILIALIHALQDRNSAISEEAKNAVISCLEALIKSGNENAVDAITPLLQHEDQEISISAASALGQIGNDEAIDTLIQALQNQNYSERWRVIKALGRQIGNDKAINALVKALQCEDSSNKGISDVVEALGQIGNLTCLEKLLQSEDPRLVYRPDVFSLTRSLAIRFSKSGSPCIPVYPELLPTHATIDGAEG